MQYCSKCGRQIPDGAVCSCEVQPQDQAPQYQQPQGQAPQYQQPQDQAPQYQQPQYQAPQYQQPQYQAPQYQQPQYQAPQYQQPQYQQPQYQPPQYQQPSRPRRQPAGGPDLGGAFSALIPFVGGSLSDPGKEIRKKTEEKNVIFAAIALCIFFVAAFVSWGGQCIGLSIEFSYDLGVGRLLGYTLVSFLLNFVFCFGANFLSVAASKQTADLAQVFVATCSALILPSVVICVGFLLSIWYPLIALVSQLTTLMLFGCNYIASTKGLKATGFTTLLIHVGLLALAGVLPVWIF